MSTILSFTLFTFSVPVRRLGRVELQARNHRRPFLNHEGSWSFLVFRRASEKAPPLCMNKMNKMNSLLLRNVQCRISCQSFLKRMALESILSFWKALSLFGPWIPCAYHISPRTSFVSRKIPLLHRCISRSVRRIRKRQRQAEKERDHHQGFPTSSGGGERSKLWLRGYGCQDEESCQLVLLLPRSELHGARFRQTSISGADRLGPEKSQPDAGPFWSSSWFWRVLVLGQQWRRVRRCAVQ